jgi:predicted signal transduction protein with EAL and GGDEF domain
MIAKADLALYAAKADGRDTARVYVPAPRERPDPSLPAAATAAQFDLFADRSAAA